MKLTFLGTRGYIEAKSGRHRMHSSLLVSRGDGRVMVDCGETWLGRLEDVSPDAIVITHAHPDHAFGLSEGAPCPVYATSDAWEKRELGGFDIEDRRAVELREEMDICGITFEAFPVLHSTRAPAVGYRISAGRAAVFYVPDVAYIVKRSEALGGVDIYIGDGATIERSMVRKHGRAIIGHVPIRTQISWCREEEVPEMIVTHCGSEIVGGDERSIGPALRRMGRDKGVEVTVAGDGMERVLR